MLINLTKLFRLDCSMIFLETNKKLFFLLFTLKQYNKPLKTLLKKPGVEVSGEPSINVTWENSLEWQVGTHNESFSLV